MLSNGASACAVISVILLFASALWAQLRYGDFDKLPAHYNFAGRATRLASRSVVIWITPAILVSTIGILVLSVLYLPPEQINGSPDRGIIIASVMIVGAQGLVLWLTERWARQQSI